MKSEHFFKLDYNLINGIKEEQYSLMQGLYSKQRPGIAYINPKVNEPHELLIGRPPRRVMIDRMKKVYSTINISSLLNKVNINYSIPNQLDDWLPLEFFDDKELDIYTAEEWISKAKNSSGLGLLIPGVGLKIDRRGAGTWNRALIKSYNFETEKFSGVWDTNEDQITEKTENILNNMEPCELPKIHLLFDAENPYLFCKKVALAHQEREKAESIIRYNYYIDKMLQDNLNDITDDQKGRLKRKIEKISFFKKMDPQVDELVKELNLNYLRTTNKIIFDKFYNGKNSSMLIINNLKLPKTIATTIDDSEKRVRRLGLEVIPKYNYITAYKSFTFGTLLCRKEIITCLHKIKEECHKIRDSGEIFNLNITAPVRLLKFKQIQNGSIAKIEKLMCKEWIKTLKETLEKSLKNIGKGSFNLKVSSKEIYEYLKLKKLMTVVKLIMQDTLYCLLTRSITKYVEFFEKFIPEEVNIVSVNNVQQDFKKITVEDELNTTNELILKGETPVAKAAESLENNPDEDEYLINPEDVWPLFKVNLIKREDKQVDITTKPEDLIKELKFFFEECLKKMQKVPQVEPELLSNLIKKAEGQTIPLKSINKTGKSEPEPTPADKIIQGYELNDDSIWVWSMYKRLEKNLLKAVEPIKPYLDQYSMFKEDLNLDPNMKIKQIKEDKEKWNVQKIKDDIVQNQQREQEILSLIPETINVSFFQINCKEFRIDLANKYNKFAEMEIELLKDRAAETTKEILNKFQFMKKEITLEINTIDNLISVKNFIESVPTMLEQLEEKTSEVNQIYEILDSFKVNIDFLQFDYKSQLLGGPTEIKNTINSIHYTLEKKKDKLYEEQLENQNRLYEEIETLTNNIRVFETFQSEDRTKEAYEFAEQVYNNLQQIMADAQLYNDREVLFDKKVTKYDMLYELKANLEPFYWLWTSIDTWNKKTSEWYYEEFSKLKGDELQNIHDELTRNLKMAYNRFVDRGDIKEKILKLTIDYKNKVANFKPTVELAIALTRKGYSDRHWAEIQQKTKIDCKPREGFTFKHILDDGMLKHLETCIDVGEKASRECMIGESLELIERKWNEIIFNTVLHKSTKIPNISNWNDIYKDLDNDISEIQQLEISSFKGPFSDKISVWGRDLLNISNVLEEWNKLQRFWIYLQPVFDSSDIAKDIPNEHKKFMMTDRMWRDLMVGVEKAPNVKLNCNSKEGLLDKLKEANMNLNNVEKGLNEYMEKKRAHFPRFYFISNSQFLEILSQTKDFKKIKDNLGKIFESIEDVELKEERYITKFYSRLKESHELCSEILIHGKNVEVWMLSLEKDIFKTVRKYMENCLADYHERSRMEWVGDHPGQSIMTVNQIGWTYEMEKAISSRSLDAYLVEYDQKIMDIVEVVRVNESRLKAITFSNLITIDVHNKNIIENLIKNGIEDKSAFEWIMQLRYYWEYTDKTEQNVMVKSVQTDFPYGYEYIGNAEILVITPLTDKCYLTLMGALRLNLGGAPAGPAGTGKTETTKDLGRSLAKLCIVYNCSEDTDYKMIGKFFKGLACCGAWICFDEFNRINLEVLSVIAQQLLRLFGSKEDKEYQIYFEGSQINILPTFCVFITMNPGYAGRSELPDNLKALFRPMAMMVPDYKLIAEISLYSSGYVSANALATKIVYTMKLSSEQLSTQTHYDFGMRAVKSVLNAARRLKRTDLLTPEDQLLLRALEDVNIPKFLTDDIPLFRNIITDLFPTTERPVIDYRELLQKCETSCKNRILLPTEYFKQKIVQLYDTLQVRHGLMLVGPAGGGKTSNYNVLKEAMTMMAAQDPKFFETRVEIINPKAIKNTEIYSELDINTGEWALGVLPTWINKFKEDTSGKIKYWIIFDGPVDAMWIEDMNSVLDDSKKLCLASSDIIVLNEMITIMFEVEDLMVASPATVSRCGMVFMEPTSLGLDPVYMCWLKKLPKLFSTTKIEKLLFDLFKKYLKKCLEVVRRQVVEPCPTVDNSLLSSLLKILDTFFEKFRPPDAKNRKTIDDELKYTESIIEYLFYYAIVWSVGVTTNEDGRHIFDKRFRELISENVTDPLFNFPASGMVYDYCFDQENKTWVHWLSTTPQYEVPNNSSYTEIIVPTADSIRNKYLVKMLIKNSKHVICTGPTGTGKTISINELLSREVGDKFITININFSAQTTARQLQDSIDGKIKKKKRNSYGPENNKTGIVFVDDLNMPVRQTSGAQPPIEFLRQWLDHEQWYDLGPLKEPKNVTDLIILGAMGPPVGGRSMLSQRFQRHFNLLGYTELEDSSIKLIFVTKLSYFLSKFTDEIKSNIDNLISSTLTIYKDIKNVMLPTPAKLHYIFNLRDMSKVIQGISSVTKHITSKVEIVRVWSHELIRVFGDRLINNTDKTWLMKNIVDSYSNIFHLEESDVHNTGNKLIFCDFNKGDSSRSYSQTTNFKDLILVINNKLSDYNDTQGKKKPLNLVMFLDACDHVCRVSRILRQPGGNALLLGVGGSGRQSLARLATYINSYDCSSVEVGKGYSMGDFMKTVKECLMKCGSNQATPQTFLLVDTQLIFTNMLETVNNILNTGEVSGIYKADDMETIKNNCKDDAKKHYGQPTETNIMKVFTNRVVKNIHVVLAMSPMGDVFAQRMRNFPSLINCSTIDWFTEWPEDALESVALDKIRQSDDFKLEHHEKNVVECFKYVHKSVERESIVFSQNLRRYFYLTPTSYLELIYMYQKILVLKRNEINQSILRLKTGLEVLDKANGEVKIMQESISLKRPQLQQTFEETEKLVAELKIETEKAKIEDEEAKEKEKEAAYLQADCSKTLAEANLKLDGVRYLIKEAISAVSKVKKEDLEEVKTIKILNPKVEFVIECLLLFKFGDAWRKDKSLILKTPNPPDKDKNVERSIYNIKDAFSRTQLDVPKFLQELAELENEENLRKLKKNNLQNMMLLDAFINKTDYTVNDIRKGTEKIVGLYEFFVCMCKYVNNSIKIIDPLLDQVEERKKEMAEAQAIMEKALKQKEIIEKKVYDLNLTKNQQEEKSRELAQDLNLQETKLKRAEALITLLSAEQGRWSKTIELLESSHQNLIGDCIIAASSVAYNGPFTFEYREKLENIWLKHIKEIGLCHSPEITMKSKLEDKIKIREWSVNGLPQDNLSIENAIIMSYSRRWPLIIDPQSQGSNFIKKMGKKLKDPHTNMALFEIVKATDASLINQIVACLKTGKMILVEGVGINLDPGLDVFLNQGNENEIRYQDNKYPAKNFKLYLSTSMPNPHYSPETFVKVTIINFGITPKGLEEQMMTLLINNEMPELEQRKNSILQENFLAQKELKKKEDEILSELEKSGGDIRKFLESDDLINILQESKNQSDDIGRKMIESEETAREIERKRENYRTAAFKGSLLFFATIALSSIDPMYQFSLQWYSKLYENSIKITPPNQDIVKRVNSLNKTFLKLLYENVCRSLFEKDKLLYSMLLNHKLMTGEFGEDLVQEKHWKFFLAGPSGDIQVAENPTTWLNTNEWPSFYKQIKYMSEHFKEVRGFDQYFLKHSSEFKMLFDSNQAHKEDLPGEWNEKFSGFLKLCFIKAIRPDKIISLLNIWISGFLGPEFIEAPGYNLSKSFKESSNVIPIVFILSPGSDPINDIIEYSKVMGFSRRFESISLGRGQEKIAIDALESTRNKGGWILLQNCHLAPSFMGRLEEIVDNFDTNWPDKDFRLWLTSMSSDKFPSSILQNSVKITIEPPKGLKNNLKRTYNKLDVKDLEDCSKPNEFKCLLFGLSFFHAIVQDRRKYGPIGWNVKYDFTQEDWTVSKKQLKIFLEQYSEIPFKVLDYLIGDINYGGRVTDDKDQRLIKNILSCYITDKIFETSSYKFSNSGIYFCPDVGDHEAYTTYIEGLPNDTMPEVFGLHDNADITTAQNEASSLLETVLAIQPKESSGGGKSMTNYLFEIAEDMEKKVGEVFDQQAVKEKYKTDYNESMNTVVLQEVIRYNALIKVMKSSLVSLKKALEGKIVMSEEIEQVGRSLSINQVPALWNNCFLSLKPLSSWIEDYAQRIQFLRNWIDNGTPVIFWFSGFSFPQAFLTASLQNYARKMKYEIDKLSFSFKIVDNLKVDQIKEKPEFGCYVYGCFLEGARWNSITHKIDDSLPKELFVNFPIIHLIPEYKREDPKTGVYHCPLYKVLSRQGTLLTTGHSTNFVLMLEIPSDDEENKWVKAGVAMFLALKQ